MTPRLASAILVGAVMRRAFAAGEHAAVITKGDADAGAVLFLVAEKGRVVKMVERGIGPAGTGQAVSVGPQHLENLQEINDYVARRMARDPDLWVIELDGANAERFAAETILTH